MVVVAIRGCELWWIVLLEDVAVDVVHVLGGGERTVVVLSVCWGLLVSVGFVGCGYC